MSKPKDHANVVDMSAHVPKLDAQASLLMDKVQERTRAVLDKLTGMMLDKADDALFELAEKADSNAIQQLYFDAMRDIRLRRGSIETGFADAIDTLFDRFVAGERINAGEKSASSARADAEPELGLVEHSDMEESIAISTMAAKAERQCYEGLFDVTARLGALTKRDELDETAHPLSPLVIGRAFGSTVKPLHIDIQVKLILYKLFEKYVMSGLALVYKEVNELLLDEGVLPHIKRTVRKAPGYGGGYAARGKQEGTGAATGGAAGGAPQYGGGAMVESAFGPVPVAGADLLGALSTMQGFAVEQGYPQGVTPEEIGGQVLEIFRRVGARFPGQGSPDMVEKTINMVSLIFDFILDDRQVPDPIKAPIARLQIPVIKVALMDNDFFARKAHPARALLNEMGRASVGWDSGKDPGMVALIDKVNESVNTILNTFEHDVAVFEQVLHEFRAFVQQQTERADKFEQRTRQTTEGEERMALAGSRVDAWIDMWTTNQTLPEFVEEFLRDVWRNTLLQTMHRYGEDSDAWDQQVKTINHLIWSIQPAESLEVGRRIVDSLPGLIKNLREGMKLAAVHPGTIAAFFNRLCQVHASSIKGVSVADVPGADLEPPAAEQAPKAAPAAAAAAAPAAPSASSAPEASTATPGEPVQPEDVDNEEWYEKVKQIVVSQSQAKPEEKKTLLEGAKPSDPPVDEMLEEIVLETPEPAAESVADAEKDEFWQVASGLEPGIWVEFTPDQGEAARAKLSWRSPATGACLFVKRNGLKYAQRSVRAFADDLRAGHVRVLDAVPLLDRAINALTARGEVGGKAAAD